MQPNIAAPTGTGLAQPDMSLPSLPTAQATTTLGNNVGQAQNLLGQSGVTAPAAPAQKAPNFWERLLPTAGGIAGGLLGGALDIGTAGLAAPLTVGLAGAGGALGQEAENKIAGTKGSTMAAGLENAAGQGVGMGAGALLGKAGGALTNAGEAGLAKQGAKTAADQEIEDASNLKNAYADVPKGLRQAYNAQGQTDYVTKLGLDATNPQNLVDVANHANDIYNSNLDEVLNKAGPVDLSEYNNTVKNAIADESGTLGSYDKVVVGKGRLGQPPSPAAKLLAQLDQRGQGVARINSDPTEARKLLQDVQALAVDAKPSVTATTGAIDPVQKSTYNVLNSVAANLKDALYNRPGVNEGISALQGNIQAGDVGGNQLLADDINKTLSGATEPQDVLSEMSRFTNMSKLGQASIKAQQDIASPAALGMAKTAATAGLPQQATNDLLSVKGAANLGGLYEGLVKGHPAAMIPGALMDVAQNPAALKGIGGLTSKIANTRIPEVLSQIGANLPNIASQQAGAGTSVGGPNTIGSTGANPLQNSLLGQTLGQDVTAGNEALADPFLAGNYSAQTNQLTQLLPIVQKIAAAQASAQNLASLVNQAGGAQGPVEGLLTRLGQTMTGGPASFLGSNIGNQQAQTQQALQAAGVQGTPMMPQVTQNQQTAQQALQNITNLLAQLGGPAQQPAPQ